jgi:hypothetical protein
MRSVRTLAKLVDALDIVGLWTNCANDCGTTVVSRRSVLSVQLSEPFDSGAASVEMVQSVGHIGELELIRGVFSFAELWKLKYGRNIGRRCQLTLLLASTSLKSRSVERSLVKGRGFCCVSRKRMSRKMQPYYVDEGQEAADQSRSVDSSWHRSPRIIRTL